MYDVLLVDDEPFAIEGLKLLINWEKYGFRISGTCENGEEAIRRIRSDPPDLVVTDIRMPGMDGLRLIEEARSAGNRSTLFVIASGYGDFEYARRAMHLGVSNYLTKPLMSDEAEEMLMRLARELEERTLNDSLVRHAEAQNVQRALTAALFEQEEALRTHKSVLQQLSQKAANWTYLNVSTESPWLAGIRAALRQVEHKAAFCRLIESGGAYGIVLGWAEDRQADHEAYGLAQQLLENLPPEAAGRVRLATGRSVSRPEELRLSLESAEQAAQHLFFGRSDLISYEETASKKLSFDAWEPSSADRIAEWVEKGNEDEIGSALAAVFEPFDRLRLAPKLVQDFAERVVLRCASVLKELGGDPERLIRESPFCGNAPPRPTLAETARCLESFCLGCRTEVLLLRERSGGGVQGQVANYLRLHYAESFTIQELAEKFYMHPAYLGQSFARKYGVGISEFVHGLRIEEACRLLRASELPSYAIAEQLGYKDYRHFLKQFEKRTGAKPAAYRTLVFR